MIRSIAILTFVISSTFAYGYPVKVENIDAAMTKGKKPKPAPPQPPPQLPTGTVLRPPETVTTNFILHGIPGAGQTSTYVVYSYSKRQDGTLVKYSASAIGNCQLEKLCKIPPGSYIVRYSNTDAFTEMLPDQLNEFSLQRFVVPKIDGKHQFRIFKDLTNLDEQKKYLKAALLNPFYASYIEYTQMSSWVGTYLKPVIDSGDVETASQTLLKEFFNHKGEVCNVAGGGNGTLTGSCYLIWAQEDPADGNFVSVMPGIYGAEWTYPDGHRQYVYGQVPQ